MSWRKLCILTWLSTGIVLGGVYAWFFGFQTLAVLQTRWIARKAPVVKLTPRNLPDSSASTARGTTLSYFGYQFEVPWDDLDQAKTKLGPNWVVLRFRSGYAIKFTSLPPREFVNGIFGGDVLKQGDKEKFRQAYGEAPLQSDYAMWQLILDATPDKVTLHGPRKDADCMAVLLLFKAMAAPEKSGLFALQGKDFKGFQWGDPQNQPRSVVVNLYADDGGLEFTFVGSGKGQPWTISQPEINRVWQTAHKVKYTAAQPSREQKLLHPW